MRRSSALFFLTSAVNSTAVIGASLLALAGVAGPHDFDRTALPLLLALAATLSVLALPAIARRRRRTTAAWHAGILVGIRDAEHTVLHPSWRLAGALGYLGFDIAVLWVTFSAVGQPPPLPALILGYLANAHCPSRAGSAYSTPASPAHSCSTAPRRRTPSPPCTSTTRSRSGYPPPADCSHTRARAQV